MTSELDGGSEVDWLQLVDDVGAAALVVGAGAVAGGIEIDADPALVVHAFQHAVAAGEVDFAVAEVEDAGKEFGGVRILRQHLAVGLDPVGGWRGGPLRVLVVEEMDAMLVALERLHDVA